MIILLINIGIAIIFGFLWQLGFESLTITALMFWVLAILTKLEDR